MARFRFWSIPLALFAISLGAYLGMVSMQVRHGSLGGSVVFEFLAWFGLAFIMYATAIFWLERWWLSERRTRPGGRPGVRGFFLVGGLWLGGCLFRWLLLQTYPTLSSDVFRYIWDGHVAVNGISPYQFPIHASQLDWLDIPYRAQAHHVHMASPYMPVAQWYFTAVAMFYPLEPISFQTAAVLMDLGTAYILSRLLALAGLPAHRLLIYLWNPLAIVETAQGAHLDTLMVLLALLAFFAMTGRTAALQRAPEAGRAAPGPSRLPFSVLAPALLALATLTKLVPLVLAPVFWWRWNWGSRLLYGYLVVGLLVAPALRAGWGLFGELDGRGLFGALRIYLDEWNFNSGLFHWLEEWLTQMGIGSPIAQAKEITFFLLFLLLVVVWLGSRQSRDDLRSTLRWLAVPLGGYLLLTTTVHPWYLLALLPLLPFLTPGTDESTRAWLWLLPWLWLSGALALSYVTYLDPANQREYELVRQLEWLPALVILGIALLSGSAGRTFRPVRG